MNEINVSIPYSLFKDIFTFAFSFRLIPSVSDDLAYVSINTAKKYWILLDSETRDDLIFVCQTYFEKGGESKDVKEFINWAGENGQCFRTREDAQKWLDFMKSMME